MDRRRLAYVLVALVAVAALFFVLRPGDDDEDEPTAAVTSSTATPPELEPSATATVEVRLGWTIDARDDELDRKSVPRETPLALTIIADVADEVHIHGYDLTAQVAPDKPATILLQAGLTGRFEIELESSHRQIAQLTVTP